MPEVLISNFSQTVWMLEEIVYIATAYTLLFTLNYVCNLTSLIFSNSNLSCKIHQEKNMSFF